MAAPLASPKRADHLSLGIMLIGFGILSYAAAWWPGILLVIGISLLTRQYLQGRGYDMVLTALIFGGLFTLFYFNIDWSMVLPVFFIVGGIYLIFREYFVTKDEESKDISDERK